ncbi:hypothetical protein PJF56_15955 [Roseofilum sp. BLCC_M91]|uniref:Uncharacterized protein n=1 Tax=Roseofilum halophilum BLCC-M91 TaxID=3022259 RepID=A0ABT7BMD8_9CYAN|nr:hypothetical protein [Roseofilum halophilum]MDJ1180359.1 hypothetical protein [Roseofilum halophilum BLCC-M91]
MTLGNAGCEKCQETGFLALLHRRVHLWEETRFLTAACKRVLLVSLPHC